MGNAATQALGTALSLDSRIDAMKLRLVAIAIFLAVPLAPLTAARPNVVLIMTDDQGYGDFSCHGNPILETPNLDRLAAQSIRFTDFHVAPSCTPTRGQLLTGLDALRNGANSPHGQFFLLKRGLQTMAELFRANQYRTALYGKWHLGGNFVDFRPHERGFQDAVHFLRGGVQSHPNPWNSDLFNDTFYHNGQLEFFPGYATDVWFDLGIRFVKERLDKQEPFFLYLPLNAPHAPLLVPDAHRRPYLKLDKATATFFGMIAGVDDRIGRLMKFLDEQQAAEDTIVVFLTDNGTANGEKVWNAGMRGKKASLYEGGHRVPCWVRWPGGELRPPTDIDALTHVQDLLPTLIELCGLEVQQPVEYDGTSLMPLLKGGSQPELQQRKLVVQSSHRHGRGTVMWRKWRWVAGEELYDLATDPGQAVNVAEDFPQVVADLQKHYQGWWSGVKDELSPQPFRVVGNGETTMLTAYDWWDGARVYNWPHLRRGDRSNGRYSVQIEKEGNYQFSLRRWPRESGAGICQSVPRHIPVDDFTAFDEKLAPFPPGKAFDIVQATVKVGEQQRSVSVQATDQEARINLQLPSGTSTLQTWFKTKQGEQFGAFYVYIQRTDG